MLTFEVPLFRLKLRDHRVAFSGRRPVDSQHRPKAAARALALGYRVLRTIESGGVRDSTEAAKRMGVAQERVSVLMGLTFLAPDIQEAILMGRLKLEGDTVRFLIQVARKVRWEDQRTMLEGSGVRREELGQKVSDS